MTLRKKRPTWSNQSLNKDKFMIGNDVDKFFDMLDDVGVTIAAVARKLYISQQALHKGRRERKLSTLWYNHIKALIKIGELQSELKLEKNRTKDLFAVMDHVRDSRLED